MMDFGWKKKAERLRMVILSAAHQLAKEMPPGLTKILEIYARVAQTGIGIDLQQEMETVVAAYPDDPRPLWEPIEVHGWTIQATMYLREDKLWWLVHAQRKTAREPSDNDIRFLDKVLDHLGAEPARHAIIAPRSSPPGEELLPFGWWTWQNRAQLYEIQINSQKKRDLEKMRIVPLGSRETEGYTALGSEALGDDEEKP